MQLKAADSKQPLIDQLTTLLARADVRTRQRIEQEIRNITAGQRAEKDAAYQIEFYAAMNPDVMTIHDLRIACNGRTAQIDHLIITRRFDFWVCESKRFAEGVEINEHGEWSAHYGEQRRGLPSPIMQNDRHVEVLRDLFASRLVSLPRNVSAEPALSFKGLVLVSDHARISRPSGDAASRVEGLDRVVKADQLRSKINAGASRSAPLVDRPTVESVARQLVKMHTPASIDFAKKFGLIGPSPDSAPGGALGPSSGLGRIVLSTGLPRYSARLASPRVCESCGDPVSDPVVEYCRDYAWLFEGSVLCVPCQDDLYPYR